MRVNEVVEITRGTLLNTPSITMFSRIICDVEQIQKGDLFIAYQADLSHITQAIQAGAYGIICEEKIKINDDEIVVDTTDFSKVNLDKIINDINLYFNK